MSTDKPDYKAITERQQATWATGDFNELARQVVPVSEATVRAADPHAGQRVLDVACGSGNAALVAARRYCEVTGIDYVPALIERAKQRAAAEGTKIDFRVGDAQELPFPDASFDVVLSVFGVMFAPDQEKAARELLRVCRPGGRIALACWMPEGFGGDFFKAVAAYVPPPPGVMPPVRWGTTAGLNALLGPGTRSIQSERRGFLQYFHSIDHTIDVFRTYFGPLNRAFQAVDPKEQPNLRRDVEAVLARYNIATDGTAVFNAEYLETIATRA
jgi:SAM-dependent methyltransferase